MNYTNYNLYKITILNYTNMSYAYELYELDVHKYNTGNESIINYRQATRTDVY